MGREGCLATSLASFPSATSCQGRGDVSLWKDPRWALCRGGRVVSEITWLWGLGLYGKRGLRRGAAPIPPGWLGRGSARDRAPKTAAPWRRPLPGRRGVTGGTRSRHRSPEQMVPRQQSCPFRIDYPGRPFNDRFPGLIKLSSPRAAVPACSPDAHPQKRRGRACGWSWGLLPSQTLISILECAVAALASPRGTRSKVSCRVWLYPAFQAAWVLEQRLPGVFPRPLFFLGAIPTTSLRGVGSAPTHVSIHNDFGGRRRELGSRRRLRSSTGCRAGRSPAIVRSCCFLHI